MQQAIETAAPDPIGARPLAGGRGWSAALDLDFSRPLPALLLGIAFALSRLPWLGLGYGADPDAWRVAMSARYLLTHGSYLPSRLPGYPVHDIATAAFLWGGWWATNAATLAVSFAGVWCFARSVRRLGLPYAGVLVLTFAFLPLTWSTSAATLDYSWALSLLLGAYLCVLERRPVLAGILLGLAGGCRISTLIFAVPLALLLFAEPPVSDVRMSSWRRLILWLQGWALRVHPRALREGDRIGPQAAPVAEGEAMGTTPAGRWWLRIRSRSPRHYPWSALRDPLSCVLRFLATTTATWVVVFAPVWLRYGTQFWNFYDVRPSWGDFLRGMTEQAFGLLPLGVIALALILSWPRVRRLPALLRTDPQVDAWAMIVLLTLFIYVRLPLQTYYLMPAAPFLLLLLARLLRPRLLLVACAALVLGGFVDFYTTSASGWRSPSALIHLRPQGGLVLQDYRLRSDRLALVRNLRALPLPRHSVITTGFYFPMVAELYHDQLRLTLPEGYLFQVGPLTDNARASDNRGVVYVWLLTQGDARTLIRQGYQIYTLDYSREERRPIVSRIYLPENERFGLH